MSRLLMACAVCACSHAHVESPRWKEDTRLVLLGQAIVPRVFGDGDRSEVGGISGAYYDVSHARLITVSDDRERPRLLTFKLRFAPKFDLVLDDVIMLERPHDGRGTLNAEGIAPAPDGNLFVSSEGDLRDAHAPGAGIFTYGRDGRFMGSTPLPQHYMRDCDDCGLRLNAGLEGLSVSPTGHHLFAATESNLEQDGHEASFGRTAITRILAYDLRVPDAPPREYAYRVDALSRPPDYRMPRGDTGVTDILAMSDTELLVLERGFVRDALSATKFVSMNTIRIYRVALDDGAELTGHSALSRPSWTGALEKRLVLDAASIAPRLTESLRDLENFEALAFGPPLPDGSQTLMLVSDDNFNPRQVTACLLFALRALEVPPAGTEVAPLLLGQ